MFNIHSIFHFLRVSEIDCPDDSFFLIAKLRDACNIEFSHVSDWDVTVIFVFEGALKCERRYICD